MVFLWRTICGLLVLLGLCVPCARVGHLSVLHQRRSFRIFAVRAGVGLFAACIFRSNIPNRVLVRIFVHRTVRLFQGAVNGSLWFLLWLFHRTTIVRFVGVMLAIFLSL